MCILEGDGIARVIWEDQQKCVDALDVFDSETPVEKGKVYWRYVSAFKLRDFGLLDYRDIPRIYPHLLRDLKTFVDKSTALKAPAHREKDDWYFYLPPSLNADRAVILSASDTADHVKEVYRGTNIEVTTLTRKPPAWKTGCQLYQLETGRYTLWQGLMDGAGNLKKQGARMVQIVKDTAKSHSVLVVAPKKFLFVFHDIPNVTAINHHHAEGRNDFQEHDIVFVFHYEPRPDVIESQAKRIFRTATDLSFERETIEIDKDGVMLERERYTDTRVQEVYDRECSARLMQSILRLRQHKNKNKVTVLFTAETVGGLPITPVPFALDDAEQCINETGNWESLPAVIEQRKAEQAAQQAAEAGAIANGDVKALMTLKGIRKSQAYKLIKDSGADTNAARDAEVIQLHLEGLSLRKIHDAIGESLGISFGTVSEIVRAYRFSTCSNKVPIKASEKLYTPGNPVATDVPAETPVKNILEWDFKTIYLRSGEVALHQDVTLLLKDLSEDHPLHCFSEDEFLRVDMEGSEINSLSIVHKDHIFDFGGSS